MKKKIIIIAEAGVNHNGKIYLAKKLIDTAKKCGADYIKFQMFKTENYITKKTPLAKYQAINLKKTINQYQMVEKLEFSKEQFQYLKAYSKLKKIKFIASCFDLESLNLYSKFNPDFYKIPSGEITNYQLLEAVGKKNKKILLSTGMSNLLEIKHSLNVLMKSGCDKKKITILQCTTDYPCKLEDVNLLTIPAIKKKFNCNVGFSDHTIYDEVAISAISLGASIIEKHLTISNKLKGPDHKASLNPKNFKIFVNRIRNLEKAFGKKKKTLLKNEKKNLYFVRKSIVAIKSIKKREIFSRHNIGAKRPANGISPMKINLFFGKKAKKNYEKDEKI